MATLFQSSQNLFFKNVPL